MLLHQIVTIVKQQKSRKLLKHPGLSTVLNYPYKLDDAIAYGHASMVKTFIETFPSLLERENSDGKTPLVDAVLYSHTQIVEYLIKKGADVNHIFFTSDEHFRIKSILMFALRRGNIDIINNLLSAGAKTEVPNNNFHIVYYLMYLGNANLLAQLLTIYPDWVNLKYNHEGHLPLTIATRRGDLASVKALLQKGANVFAMTLCDDIEISIDGKCSALDWARYHGDYNLYLVLLNAWFPLDSKLVNILANQNNQFLIILVELFYQRILNLDILIEILEHENPHSLANSFLYHHKSWFKKEIGYIQKHPKPFSMTLAFYLMYLHDLSYFVFHDLIALHPTPFILACIFKIDEKEFNFNTAKIRYYYSHFDIKNIHKTIFKNIKKDMLIQSGKCTLDDEYSNPPTLDQYPVMRNALINNVYEYQRFFSPKKLQEPWYKQKERQREEQESTHFLSKIKTYA